MRPLAVVVVLLASILGSGGEGSSAHCRVFSFSLAPFLWLCRALYGDRLACRCCHGNLAWQFLHVVAFQALIEHPRESIV